MIDHIAMADRITDLPWDTLDNILGRLPIKDSVKTTILSRKWRDKWIDISKLVFDEVAVGEWTFVNFVYIVMLSHRSSIDKFMLTTKHFTETKHLDDWILFLRRNDIKELVLDMHQSRYYELPSCLFSWQHLSHLHLTGCVVVIPHTFTGFRNLAFLQLKRFRVDGTKIESLIRSCPMLEKLVLSDFSCDPKCLNIYAPNLRSLYLKGHFNDVYLENSSRLSVATFKMKKSDEHVLDRMAHNLVNPHCQSHIERLTLSGNFVKVLATKCGLYGIFFACDHLKFLELSKVHFSDMIHVTFILSILRNSSNLKELSISIVGESKENVYEFIKGQDQLGYCFDQLRVVKINININVYGNNRSEEAYNSRSDLEFIKLVLACSPILEKMVVNYVVEYSGNTWVMKKLMSFKRASTKLMFKFLRLNTSVL